MVLPLFLVVWQLSAFTAFFVGFYAICCPATMLCDLSSRMGEGCCFPCCCPGALLGLRIKLRVENNIQVNQQLYLHSLLIRQTDRQTDSRKAHQQSDQCPSSSKTELSSLFSTHLFLLYRNLFSWKLYPLYRLTQTHRQKGRQWNGCHGNEGFPSALVGNFSFYRMLLKPLLLRDNCYLVWGG